jgi:hypothetical protein
MLLVNPDHQPYYFSTESWSQFGKNRHSSYPVSQIQLKFSKEIFTNFQFIVPI